MKTVNVATLKEKLSAYLRKVQEGEEIIVTSHRRPVARVVPESEALDIRHPSRPLSALRRIPGVRLRRGVSAVDALIEDRRRP